MFGPLHTPPYSLFFFFNDTATTEIYTLSLHDALPILSTSRLHRAWCANTRSATIRAPALYLGNGSPVGSTSSKLDRKSTRLNSSHQIISYAVFCLKKKKHKGTCMHPLT